MLTFDLLTLKVVSESRVTWAIPVPILVFLDLSVVNLGPMYASHQVNILINVQQLMQQVASSETSIQTSAWCNIKTILQSSVHICIQQKQSSVLK